MGAQKHNLKQLLFNHVSKSDMLVATIICVIGIASRLVPHFANFSPVFALALFAGFYFRKSLLAWIVPFAMIIISDVFLGMYAIAPIVWLSYMAMALGARTFMKKGTLTGSIGAGMAAALWFFVVTNFAVWTEGRMYAMTFQGLIDCYVAGLPFLRPTLLSAVFYSVLFFSGYRIWLQGGVGHRTAVVKSNS